MTPISTLLFLNVYASRFVIIDVRSPRLFGAFVRVSLGVFCFRLGSLAIYPTVLSADLFGLFGWKAGSCPALLFLSTASDVRQRPVSRTARIRLQKAPFWQPGARGR